VPRAGRSCPTLPGVEVATIAGPARVDVAGQASPRLLLALTHGAAGLPDTPDLVAVAQAGEDIGAAVALVTQAYRVAGARAPGAAARQDAAWLDVTRALRRRCPGIPFVQGGRSNGARLACRTAREAGAAGVIALAFPLRPPGRAGRPGPSRAGELRAAGVPVLVINGDRDPFGVPDASDADRLVVLAGEDHALRRDPARVADAVREWLADLARRAGWP